MIVPIRLGDDALEEKLESGEQQQQNEKLAEFDAKVERQQRSQQI